jgi:hypothetical protein
MSRRSKTLLSIKEGVWLFSLLGVLAKVASSFSSADRFRVSRALLLLLRRISPFHGSQTRKGTSRQRPALSLLRKTELLVDRSEARKKAQRSISRHFPVRRVTRVTGLLEVYGLLPIPPILVGVSPRFVRPFLTLEVKGTPVTSRLPR